MRMTRLTTATALAGLAAAASALAQPCFEVQKLTAFDAAANDRFGRSVAIDGNTMAIGTYLDDDAVADCGSVYVFERDGAGSPWTFSAKLLAPDAQASDQFGFIVALQGDTLVVGANLANAAGNDSGAAYVFTRVGGAWTGPQKLLASDGAAGDQFGLDLALDGDTLLVGAPLDDFSSGSDRGSAYIFENLGGVWTERQKLTASDSGAGDNFGIRVDIRGNRLIVGAHLDDDLGGNAGAAYIFERAGDVWTEHTKLLAPGGAAGDQAGVNVAIDGDWAAVGRHLDNTPEGEDAGSVDLYQRIDGKWTHAVWLYPHSANAITDDRFGSDLYLKDDTLAVVAQLANMGATDTGALYLFRRNPVNNVWTQQRILLASDAAQSDTMFCAAFDGVTLVAGAYLDNSPITDAGSAYVFDLTECLGLPAEVGCPPDLTGDGLVDGADLAEVLGAWGPCPEAP